MDVEHKVSYPPCPLRCAGFMCFNFWNKLARRLGRSHPPGMEQASAELAAKEQQRRREFFAPAYERLVQLIRGRVRCGRRAGVQLPFARWGGRRTGCG